MRPWLATLAGLGSGVFMGVWLAHGDRWMLAVSVYGVMVWAGLWLEQIRKEHR